MNFFPEHSKLHFRQAVTHATMNPKAERNMTARVGAIDHQPIRLRKNTFVPVTGQVPHHHLLARPYQFIAQTLVGQSSAAHMNHRRLPTNHFRDHVRNQFWTIHQQPVLIRKLVQRQNPTRDTVAGGVVAPDDK